MSLNPEKDPDNPDVWNVFRLEVIARLTRIETRLDGLPCENHKNKIEKIQSNQLKAIGGLMVIAFVAALIGSVIAF